MSAASRLTRAWYTPRATALANALRPISWLFGLLAAARRTAYRNGWLQRVRLRVPVIVVGNLTAGGAGKTPLVIALVDALRARGRHPGIVSRGYGRRATATRGVDIGDDPDDVGDEPLLLAATGVPVFVGVDRAAAAQALLAAHPQVDVIVTDDGLQHYALARDVEIAVIDGARVLGNRLLLPAGPLREPPSRLASVDAIVTLESGVHAPASAPPREFAMRYAPQPWRNLVDASRVFDVALLHDAATVAIAGIAHPERFFATLRAGGFTGATHPFPDHHRYVRDDLAYPRARAVLMTEKDAVKCQAFADARMWMLPIAARIDPRLVDLVMEKVDGPQAARDARVPGHQGPVDP
jgi:tetraacyldisaccharide 4'-kinase